MNFCNCLICCYIGGNLQGQTGLLELSLPAWETERIAWINSQCTSLQRLPIHLHWSLTHCQDDSTGLETDRQPHHKNTRRFISLEAQQRMQGPWERENRDEVFSVNRGWCHNLPVWSGGSQPCYCLCNVFPRVTQENSVSKGLWQIIFRSSHTFWKQTNKHCHHHLQNNTLYIFLGLYLW